MPEFIDPYRFVCGGFMPNVVMEAEISHASKVCYIALASFAGKGNHTCWPSQETLADRYNSNSRSTREHLQELEVAGFITITQQGLNRVNVYQFLSLERRDPGPAEIRHTGPEDPAGPGPAENRRSRTAENRRSLTLTEPLSLEPLSKRASDEVTQSAASADESQSQPPPSLEESPEVQAETPGPVSTESAEEAPGFSEQDLHLADPPEKFLQDAYSRTRRGKFRRTGSRAAGLQGYLLLESRNTPAATRTAFLRYLEKDDQWLRDNHWPLPYFVKNFGQFEMYEPRPWSAPAETPAPSPALEEPVTATHVFHGLALHLIAERWNELVPSQPVVWVRGSQPKYHPSIETPQFAGMFVELCRKAEAMISDPKNDCAWWLTFHWVIGEKDGIANWTKLAGKSFGMKRKGPEVAESLTDRVRREMREANA